MGLIPEQSFTVRKPAWHGQGVVLQDYPGIEEAIKLAGHDWDVIELPAFAGIPLDHPSLNPEWEIAPPAGFKRMPNGYLRREEETVFHVRSDNLFTLAANADSFERIPNRLAWEVCELLFDQGFLPESAGSMDGGRLCYVTLLLNEPIVIAGHEGTLALPFGSASWAHDGSGSFRVRSGTIVQVCQNTVTASEAEGEKLGTDFTFRHTKNVRDRIEDAKQVVKGLRAGVAAYTEVMEELVALEVTPGQRDLFVSTIIGDQDGKSGVPVSMRPDTTVRVKNNIAAERAKIDALFMGPTVPEELRLTGYGLFQAGVEYFDHLRRFRSQESYVKRTLISHNPAKANLTKTIRQIAEVAA